MKRLLRIRVFIVAFALAECLLVQAGSHAADKVVVYLFWSEGCPHCRDEKAFLDAMAKRYPQLDVNYLEVKKNPANAKLFSDMAEAYGVKLTGVPATFIGDAEPIVGYRGDGTTGRDIEERIQGCIRDGCPDPHERLDRPGGQLLLPQPDLTGPAGGEQGVCLQDEECPEEAPAKSTASPVPKPQAAGKTAVAPRTSVTGPVEKKESVVELPLLGKVDTSKESLLYQTVAIAGLDGFNPCAFFVLFALLGLLLHVHSRKRLLLVGGIFVFFSGFIYFIFMAAWLNIFLLTGRIAAVTVAAGAVALVIAVINIKDFFFFKKGVSLVIPESAKPKLFDRMRKLMKATSLLSVITGTVVLAVAANAYELFCTAGFPMVYARILTLHNLSKFEYYLYLVLYNVVYVMPLAMIVLFFAATLGAKKLTAQQGQVLKLISGMMMLCLGGVLLARPELLNNVAVTGGLLGISLGLSGIVMLVTRRIGIREG
ncbi:MAG: thioredoxin family protein [Nitrospiraceae bacterium]|nr:thioredoxin family protein [Nitrospiraceae bacterium]